MVALDYEQKPLQSDQILGRAGNETRALGFCYTWKKIIPSFQCFKMLLVSFSYRKLWLDKNCALRLKIRAFIKLCLKVILFLRYTLLNIIYLLYTVFAYNTRHDSNRHFTMHQPSTRSAVVSDLHVYQIHIRIMCRACYVEDTLPFFYMPEILIVHTFVHRNHNVCTRLVFWVITHTKETENYRRHPTVWYSYICSSSGATKTSVV